MTTAETTYSNRSNAAAAARSALGNKAAKIGVDFQVEPQGERYTFKLAPAPAAAPAPKAPKAKAAKPAAEPAMPAPPAHAGGRFDPTAGADEAEAARPAKAAKVKAAPKLSKKAEAEALIAAGKVPPGPVFSDRTQKRYVDKLAEINGLIEDRDVKGLKALEIPNHDNIKLSWHSLHNYRVNAVAALEARAKLAKG